MKQIIEESGMTAKQFSDYYEIPYQTVHHWLNGDRKAPAWAVKLMREKIEREKMRQSIIALSLNKHYTNHGYTVKGCKFISRRA